MVIGGVKFVIEVTYAVPEPAHPLVVIAVTASFVVIFVLILLRLRKD